MSKHSVLGSFFNWVTSKVFFFACGRHRFKAFFSFPPTSSFLIITRNYFLLSWPRKNSLLLFWSKRIRTSDHVTKNRCLSTWLYSKNNSIWNDGWARQVGRDSLLTPHFLQLFVSVSHFESFLLLAFHIEANEFKQIQTLYSTCFF